MAEDIEKIFKDINAKLSALISLSLNEKPNSIRDKVVLLSDLGVSNTDISKILRISEIHVSKEKSLNKKLMRRG